MAGIGIANAAPRGADWISQKFTDLQRQINELRPARSLNASEIDPSGTLTVNGTVDVVGSLVVGGDLSLTGTETVTGSIVVDAPGTVDVGGPGNAQVVLDVGTDGLNNFGQIRFDSAHTRAGTAPAITLSDPAAGPDALQLTSRASVAGAQSFVQLGQTEIALEVDSSAGSPAATLQLYSGQCDFIAGVSGGVSLRSNAIDASAGTTWYGGVGSEWRATALGTTSTYIAVRASSFPVGSSREIKQDITDLPFDALAVVQAAPAKAWKYQPRHAADDAVHFGPLAEDLPSELTHLADDVLSVDLRDLLGVLWAATGQLAGRVAELERRGIGPDLP